MPRAPLARKTQSRRIVADAAVLDTDNLNREQVKILSYLLPCLPQATP